MNENETDMLRDYWTKGRGAEPLADGTIGLREQLTQARADFVKAQTHLSRLEWQLFRIRYQDYLDRAEQHGREHPGPQLLDQWVRKVRPVCRDCRMEVTDLDSRHSLNGSADEGVFVTCGRSRAW